MKDLQIAGAQADMRAGYISGAPGIAVSAVAWLAAASVALFRSPDAAVWTLLVAGAFIHPVSVLLTKVLGRRGAHQPGNPLARLAMESTIWMLMGIAVAFILSTLRIEWFFPAMLLVIGGRYLTFQTLYGLSIYWALGGTLCVAGIGLALTRASPLFSALAGGVIELLFAGLIYARAGLAGRDS